MKVKDLIKKLEEIEDKDLEVVIHCGVIFDGIRKVSTKTINNKGFQNEITDRKVVFLHRGEFK